MFPENNFKKSLSKLSICQLQEQTSRQDFEILQNLMTTLCFNIRENSYVPELQISTIITSEQQNI